MDELNKAITLKTFCCKKMKVVTKKPIELQRHVVISYQSSFANKIMNKETRMDSFDKNKTLCYVCSRQAE